MTLLPSRLPMLTDVFVRERKLVDELVAVLERQREAVRQSDVEEIGVTVEVTHRLLTTLTEARRRRHLLMRLGPDAAVPLSDLETLVPAPLDPELQEARDDLVKAAARLAEAVPLNREALVRAIANGEEHLREAFPDGTP